MIEFKQTELRGATPKKIVFTPKDNDGTLTGVQDPVAHSSNDLVFGVGPVEVVGNQVKVPLTPGDQHTVGVAQLTLTSDTDLGPGVEPLAYVVDIKVNPDNAAGFDVTVE
jgi:hypothetical protein